jgi:hypothetical protein
MNCQTFFRRIQAHQLFHLCFAYYQSTHDISPSGDIAILLHAGLSMKRALLYNFLAALFAFAGLVLGIILGETTAAAEWILAFGGGLFTYLALTDLVSH